MVSPRVRKIADRIQVIVAEMLERRIKDPRLGFVTITDVRLTGDTQQATIFYTVLAGGDRRSRSDEAALAATAAALESAKGLIRSEVAKQLGMRHTPSLTFVADALPGVGAAPRRGAGQGPGPRRGGRRPARRDVRRRARTPTRSRASSRTTPRTPRTTTRPTTSDG